MLIRRESFSEFVAIFLSLFHMVFLALSKAKNRRSHWPGYSARRRQRAPHSSRRFGLPRHSRHWPHPESDAPHLRVLLCALVGAQFS